MCAAALEPAGIAFPSASRSALCALGATPAPHPASSSIEHASAAIRAYVNETSLGSGDHPRLIDRQRLRRSFASADDRVRDERRDALREMLGVGDELRLELRLDLRARELGHRRADVD